MFQSSSTHPADRSWDSDPHLTLRSSKSSSCITWFFATFLSPLPLLLSRDFVCVVAHPIHTIYSSLTTITEDYSLKHPTKIATTQLETAHAGVTAIK